MSGNSSNSGNGRRMGGLSLMERRAFLRLSGWGLMLAVGSGMVSATGGCGGGGSVNIGDFIDDPDPFFYVSPLDTDGPNDIGGNAATGPVLLYVGQSLPLLATFDSVRLRNSNVEWTVLGGAGQGTIDSSGVYTAPTTAPLSGSVVVKAQRRSVPSQSMTVPLRVVPRVTITPATASVNYGGQVQFTAQVEGPPAGVEPGVIWTVEGGSFDPHFRGTITPDRLYTAPSAAGPGVWSAVTVYARPKYDVSGNVTSSGSAIVNIGVSPTG